MRLGSLIILLLVCLSCKNNNDSKSTSTKSKRFELLPEPDKIEKEKSLQNYNLTSFLENPLDLQHFKSLKNSNYVTTGVGNAMYFHFHPKIKDSIFYVYNYPPKDLNSNNFQKLNCILVFKYGENKHRYDDKTEILIELLVFNKDLDLGKANLVGLTKTELESQFGTNYLTFDKGIAYSQKNKILILEIESSKIKSYRYLKLSKEEIDKELIEDILK